jgi:outer membrane murein-binding lipoprotein Lpp
MKKHITNFVLVIFTLSGLFYFCGCAHIEKSDLAATEAQDAIMKATTLSEKIEAESRYLQSR